MMGQFRRAIEHATMPRAPRMKTEDGAANLVGPQVKARRLELGLSHDDVCARIAQATSGRWIPLRQDIYKIEARMRGVSDLEVITFAQVLDCVPNWLLAVPADKASTSSPEWIR